MGIDFFIGYFVRFFDNFRRYVVDVYVIIYVIYSCFKYYLKLFGIDEEEIVYRL